MLIIYTIVTFLVAICCLLDVPRKLRRGRRRYAVMILLVGIGAAVNGISGCYFITGYDSQPSSTLLFIGCVILGIGIYLSQRWVGEM